MQPRRELVRATKVVDVPTTRQVRVPAWQERIVPGVRKEVVPQKSFVDDVEYVMQEEAYTDYEQVPHTRMKEIWVKRMVPETVYETVAVPKTRQRTVAQPVVREVTTLAEVNVPVEEIVREPCYRIDEVEEVAKTEVEVCQEVEWVPRIVGQWEENEHVVAHSRTSERTLGYERAVGYETTFVSPQTQVQGRDPVRYRAVASRHSVASPRVGEVGVTTLDTKYDATRRPTPRAYPPEVVVRPRASPFKTDVLASEKAGQAQLQGPGIHQPQGFREQAPPPPPPPAPRVHLGLSITETKNGLMVKDIVSRGLAARSGMQRGDLLVAVDGVPVATHEEFQCQLRGKVAFDIEVYDGSTQQYLKRRVNG
jgi:hypothetical protein